MVPPFTAQLGPTRSVRPAGWSDRPDPLKFACKRCHGCAGAASLEGPQAPQAASQIIDSYKASYSPERLEDLPQ